MPPLGSTMEGRNQLFQKLKPTCVALSQAALALSGQRGDVPSVTVALEQLQQILSTAVANSASLDEKLADYVFFPLSQILKISQRVSVRCLELSFQCLAILIDQGWRSRVQPRLATQIVFLCTLMAEVSPKNLAVSETTDELRAGALWCLYHLFSVLDSKSESRNALIIESNFPQIGQTITTILDGVVDSTSVEVQISGVKALQKMMENVATQSIHAAFLPGVVSKLVRVLTPHTKQRRNHSVLIGALSVLCMLFTSTLSHVVIEGVSKSVGRSENARNTRPTSVPIDEKWLQTAATQLKPALTNINRLSSHSRQDVKDNLARLCFVVLIECSETLANCSSIAINTLVSLSSEENGNRIRSKLEATAKISRPMCNLLMETIYVKLHSLTTIMQSADDQAKIRTVAQINIIYQILSATETDLSITSQSISTALRDGVVVMLRTSKAPSEVVMPPVQSLDLVVPSGIEPNITFRSPLVRYESQQNIHKEIETLAKHVSCSNNASFGVDFARELWQSRGDTQIANTYLLLQALEAMLHQRKEVSDIADFGQDGIRAQHGYLEQLYSFSLDVLSDGSEEPLDPRLRALALRALALRARYEGKEFRHELIDALYPVLHTLATPDQLLQHDSITTLNIFTSACQYSSVKDLIVKNVDYLTNAVSLQLNAFEVGPQAPQVLLMMVRLAGPSLLPYLEDTIDSIFAALENYHGYSLLVELLFKVLSVIAEEGVRVTQLSITDGSRKAFLHMREDHWRPTSVSALAQTLRERHTDEETALAADGRQRESHPERHWKDIEKANIDGIEDQAEEELEDELEDEQETEEQAVEDVELPPPAPKTYNILFKITELTQHYLPSASPSLRGSLLKLIRTTTPAISKHENSFLPLINTLWPEIVSRLDDPEPHIVASSLDIIAVLCEYAQDFMRSRIAKLWPGLVAIHGSVARDITQANKPRGPPTGVAHDSSAVITKNRQLNDAIARLRSAPADYIDTSSRLVWTALSAALTTIVRHVVLPPDLVDEAMEMLEPVLADKNVKAALEDENSDAVWLIRLRTGAVRCPPMPEVGATWRFVDVSG